MYEDLKLYIDGAFTAGASGTGEAVVNPANDEVLGHVPHARQAEMDAALGAAVVALEYQVFPAPDR